MTYIYMGENNIIREYQKTILEYRKALISAKLEIVKSQKFISILSDFRNWPIREMDEENIKDAIKSGNFDMVMENVITALENFDVDKYLDNKSEKTEETKQEVSNVIAFKGLKNEQ